jgi:hypothetical protein
MDGSMSDSLIEIGRALALAAGVAMLGAALGFGTVAGIIAASKWFGPIKIDFKIPTTFEVNHHERKMHS